MKSKILRVLMENSPDNVSGEELGRMLNVSRTAVWKHISELREDGYSIESSSRSGYRLTGIPDRISPERLTNEAGFIGEKIRLLDTVDSTNAFAKRLAAEGCPEGTVVLAESQTAGRGRLGREWSSPGGSGIWMSVVLRPSIQPSEVQLITLAAAAAVAAAIRNTTGIAAGIKWPNDIVLEGKKLCGILTEMASEMDRVNYLVVGIGINVNQAEQDFAPDIRERAISLKIHSRNIGMGIQKFDRNDIIKELMLQLERTYNSVKTGKTGSVIEEWRSFSVTLGREVRVLFKGSEYTGTAVDITDDGGLLVRCADGTLREILSGEISVRGLFGYT